MNIGILLPGFSADETDWAIPVQRDLIRALAQDDDVRVLALRYPPPRPPYALEGAEVYTLGAGQVRGRGRLALWLRTLNTLSRMHQQRPFHVLHAMWSDETGLLAAWAGKRLNVPAVTSLAGGELVGFKDIGYGLQRGAFSRWIVRQALEQAAAVIAPCGYTADLITARGYRIPAERLHRVPLGVDSTRFQSSAQAPDTDLISAGSLIGVKDHETLLRALALLPHTTTLRLVGDGPEKPRLQALAGKLGLNQQITFAGSIPYLTMPQELARARIHVLPSRHEGFGMVTIEAAACGLPTVGSAVGVLADDPALGISVPPGDAPALATAIRALLDNPAQRRALGQQAQQRVAAMYRIEHTAAALRKLYSSLNPTLIPYPSPSGRRESDKNGDL